ncbi:hypothetical protein HXR07_002707 [Salmonella enterica]|nr:hypothetical protein [Salmonella enterica]
MFPAPAGINRFSLQADQRFQGVPRASGDKPFDRIEDLVADMCSPRQRG